MSYFSGNDDVPRFSGEWYDEEDRYGRPNPDLQEFDQLVEDIVYWAAELEPGDPDYDTTVDEVQQLLLDEATPYDMAEYFELDGYYDIEDFPWDEWREYMGYA